MRTSHNDVKVNPGANTDESAEVDGRTLLVTGKWLKIAAIKDEELVEGEAVADPEPFILRLRQKCPQADIFTFAQKLPDTVPRYPYQLEWDNPAVIPVTTFAEWWEKRAESSVRRAVRKAAKVGVVTNVVEFGDALVGGIVEIYNETPIRQGRTFWHYQKDVNIVRRENSTYLERSCILGAHLNGELIGFLRMIYVDKIATIIQILSKTKHFDKRPTNALIAKAVEICEQQGVSHLVYCNYIYNDPTSSLTEFKRRNGFEQVLLPRYYVPLTLKGRIALKLNLHHELAQHIPAPLIARLRKIRALWNRHRSPVQDSAS